MREIEEKGWRLREGEREREREKEKYKSWRPTD